MVYAIRGIKTNLIKIGVTSVVDVRKRMKILQVGSPDILEIIGILTTPDGMTDYKYEIDIHYRFRALRHHGEWFRSSPTLLNYIDRNSSAALLAAVNNSRQPREKRVRFVDLVSIPWLESKVL